MTFEHKMSTVILQTYGVRIGQGFICEIGGSLLEAYCLSDLATDLTLKVLLRVKGQLTPAVIRLDGGNDEYPILRATIIKIDISLDRGY